MLSRNLKRALLDSRWPLPPTFLLPWAASLTTVSHTTDTGNVPPPLLHSAQHIDPERLLNQASTSKTLAPSLPTESDAPALPAPSQSAPVLSESVRALLPLLQAQGSHYITAHIYSRPYLLTQGDTLRLPFLMKGVQPGDVLRLNQASNLGSRDYTLKASAPAPKLKSATHASVSVLDPTTGTLASHSRVMPTTTNTDGSQMAPHFIPHIAKGKVSYLDERLFVCRAVVMGIESEPMRSKEKTKRRNRKIKTIKSKHKYTILKIKEVRVRGVEEVEGEAGSAAELD